MISSENLGDLARERAPRIICRELGRRHHREVYRGRGEEPSGPLSSPNSPSLSPPGPTSSPASLSSRAQVQRLHQLHRLHIHHIHRLPDLHQIHLGRGPLGAPPPPTSPGPPTRDPRPLHEVHRPAARGAGTRTRGEGPLALPPDAGRFCRATRDDHPSSPDSEDSTDDLGPPAGAGRPGRRGRGARAAPRLWSLPIRWSRWIWIAWWRS